MDRATVAQFDVDKIPQALESRGWGDRWNRLIELSGDDAVHLLKLVCDVTPPERICELRDLEAGQARRGAGFLDMLPDQVPDDLGVPNDLETSLDVAIRLSAIRAATSGPPGMQRLGGFSPFTTASA